MWTLLVCVRVCLLVISLATLHRPPSALIDRSFGCQDTLVASSTSDMRRFGNHSLREQSNQSLAITLEHHGSSGRMTKQSVAERKTENRRAK